MDDNDVENTGGTGSTDNGAPASDAPAIDPGAVLWSASEADRVGRPLLLILHGYGSHEGDLFSLAPHLPLKPVLAALRAPLPVGDGWAWFPIGVPGADVNPSAPSATAVEAATDSVLAWLDALVVPPASVGLLGFSQGGAMALQLLRQAPDRFAFAVQLSGFVAGAPQPGDAELAERPVPVFWGRGTADPVIQADAVGRTQAWLPGHSVLTERIYEGMGHSISQGELSDIVGFLRAQYADAPAGTDATEA
ncbi:MULTISPECIES: alpha/beta hydrolase [unclassified Cryobacterium]|jgi:phospholipase/carboxylesterase|uniref:alpha/beta hydrolase n=1 Tax=unclassified Cryobacterium TaxID=2649013 RepID=UPI002B226026|nr:MULTISPECIES: alpha/beta fold hydrolase [unclassified Cryobacterium]MEA9998200.1 alpha/beta hydrolase-fold protein [Cryobacterium sp. RTS3]MEB0266329.1 alpha/beta hydrolase-fold protein [Cryobacterium sp. 10I5]